MRLRVIGAGDQGRQGSMTACSGVWLDVRPAARRLARALSYTAIGIGVVSFLALVTWINIRSAGGRVHQMTSLWVVGSPVIILAATICVAAYLRGLSPLGLSLGTDGARLLVQRQGRVIERAPLEQITTNGDYLLVGRRLVPLRYGFVEAFDRVVLAQQIVGVLPRTALISTSGLLWRAVRAGNLGVWACVVAVCLILVWKYFLSA
ncbi:MAG TPA: hypothetical protein VI653_31380 [Steroidobacteraceae bacterium]